MYYKLPVKERMELMKSYRKANKDMSYKDMVSDYNNSYLKKYPDGGKVDLSKVKLNYAKSNIEAEEMIKKGEIDTRRRVDENGDDQGENFFEMIDPSGVSSWNDISKEYDRSGFSLKTGVEVLGAVPLIGKISKLFKPAIHLSKNTPNFIKFQKAVSNHKVSDGINYLGKTGRASDGYQYATADYEKFGDGGIKREPIITNDPKDIRLRAYNDSLDTYQWNKKALDKVLSTGKSPQGSNVNYNNYQKRSKEEQLNLDYKKYKDLGLNITKKDVDDQMANVDPLNKGTKKLNRAISYYDFPKEGGGNFKLAQYKKPVQPYIYQPPEKIPPANIIPPIQIPPIVPQVKKEQPKQDTVQYIPKQQIFNSDTTRRWNFNGSVPVLEYYDNSNKLIKQEYYKNMEDFKKGKQLSILNK